MPEQSNGFPWKVLNDDYPTDARTSSGEILHFDDVLAEGQRVGHGDGEGGVYPPYGRVVRRDDGLWIEAEEPTEQSTAVEVGQRWHRINMRERVEVTRIWEICACDEPVMHGYVAEHGAGSVQAIRCRPLHGGAEWFTTVPEFLRRFEQERRS